MQVGNSLEILWMLEGCPSAVKNPLVPVQITSVKRMAYGPSWVRIPLCVSPWTELDGFTAWLNILASANAKSPNKLIGIKELLAEFYSTYGRSFFSRYDYEEVSSEGAQALVSHLNTARESQSLINATYTSSFTSTKFTISRLYDFDYTDPIDESVSKNQGQVILFDDGSRVVFRLSGTGSQGATVRMYVERYLGPEAGPKELGAEAAEGLKGLIEVALEVSKLKEFLGRDKPTVITVSSLTFHENIFVDCFTFQ
jgi:phosphoglucomutase